MNCLTGFDTFKSPAPTFPNACHVSEVEIDPETGVIRVLRYVAVDDVGTVMNPMLLKGQLHGGMMQFKVIRHLLGPTNLPRSSFARLVYLI